MDRSRTNQRHGQGLRPRANALPRPRSRTSAGVFLSLCFHPVVDITNYEREDNPGSTIIRVCELFYDTFETTSPPKPLYRSEVRGRVSLTEHIRLIYAKRIAECRFGSRGFITPGTPGCVRNYSLDGTPMKYRKQIPDAGVFIPEIDGELPPPDYPIFRRGSRTPGGSSLAELGDPVAKSVDVVATHSIR